MVTELIDEYFPFDQYRDGQKEIICDINDFFLSGGRVYMLDAPTGVGKSGIGITVANQVVGDYGGDCHYVVCNKFLEDQILRDFNFVKKVMGRNNFYCLNIHRKTGGRSRITCDKGVCKRKVRCNHSVTNRVSDNKGFAFKSYRRGDLYWKDSDHCKYWEQKANAINSDIVIHNFHYFLTELNYVNDFGQRSLLVIDEAHNIEKMLLDFISFGITERHNKYNLEIPKFKEDVDIDECLSYLNECGYKLELMESFLLGEFENIINKKVEKTVGGRVYRYSIDDLERVSGLKKRVELITHEMMEDENNWVIVKEKDNKRIDFKPIHVDVFFEKYVGRFGKKILMMSATLLNKVMFHKTVGYEGSGKFMQMDSPFSVANRTVYVDGVGKMSRNHIANTMPNLINKIDEIMNEYPDSKGLIHTNSYKIGEEIVNKLGKRRLVFHSSENRNQVLDDFVNDYKSNKVLISPSSEEGLDLKDDLCRFIIISKVPFLHFGDKQIIKRKEYDDNEIKSFRNVMKENYLKKKRGEEDYKIYTQDDYDFLFSWYDYKTIQKLIQMCGRGTRSIDDWSKTYILDSSFNYLYKNNQRLFPDWFKKSLKFL